MRVIGAAKSVGIWAARLLGLIVVGLALLIVAMWIDHLAPTTLPYPTGDFAVGRASFDWVDGSQSSEPVLASEGRRELMVWIWFPTGPASSMATSSEYLPLPWIQALSESRGALMTNLLQRELSRVRAHSQMNSAVSNRLPAYPVIIMRAGMAALTTDYTTLAEDLASHGYVVVGMDAPYRTQLVVFPDGRRIARSRENNADLVGGAAKETMALRLESAWADDIAFVLDRLDQLNVSDPSGQFTGRLDLARVGIWGHSLGGSTALQFCHTDHRCKAGVDVDGLPLGSVIKDGLDKPFMFLMSDHSREQGDPESIRIDANLKSIYRTLPPADRFWVVLKGANHFGFSDGALLKSPILQNVLHSLGVLGMDGQQQLTMSRRCLSEFFDIYLKGAPRGEMSSLNTLSNSQP